MIGSQTNIIINDEGTALISDIYSVASNKQRYLMTLGRNPYLSLTHEQEEINQQWLEMDVFSFGTTALEVCRWI